MVVCGSKHSRRADQKGWVVDWLALLKKEVRKILVTIVMLRYRFRENMSKVRRNEASAMDE
jgi:hypothetical protein